MKAQIKQSSVVQVHSNMDIKFLKCLSFINQAKIKKYEFKISVNKLAQLQDRIYKINLCQGTYGVSSSDEWQLVCQDDSLQQDNDGPVLGVTHPVTHSFASNCFKMTGVIITKPCPRQA